MKTKAASVIFILTIIFINAKVIIYIFKKLN